MADPSQEIRPKHTGNLLGAGRAEVDTRMLEKAFVRTSDYEALTTTYDFNFVVGRRGAGKTALFLKVQEFFKKKSKIILNSYRFEEHDSIALTSWADSWVKSSEGDYRSVRALLRVTWRAVILLDLLPQLDNHWKRGRIDGDDYLAKYAKERSELLSVGGVARCLKILRQYSTPDISVGELPGVIVTELELGKLEGRIKDALSSLNTLAVTLFDGLDEGWQPTQTSTALLGGLALAVADFRDHQTDLYGLLFIRDNLFRALAKFDPDFSRHIEGASLRLHWDDNGLLLIVANRLRVSLNLGEMENNIRVWNRFAHRELQNRDGFNKCLQHTLYRPRDILVLLNEAFQLAARGGRSELVEEDIEAVSQKISESRLSDLEKEYETVFPGLKVIIGTFRGTSPFYEMGSLVPEFNRLISENDYSEIGSSDLAILGSGEQIFYALYSIGFLGFQDSNSEGLSFCHDGGAADIAATEPSQKIAIHPCYWKALGIADTNLPISIISEVHDEYKVKATSEAQDMRTRQLGTLVSELPNMPTGAEGATIFEEWVFRSVRILFSGALANPGLKPNDDAVQRRDIVATIMAQSGFWRRVLEDYRCRQIVFEVKNYQDLKLEDYRQVLSYTTNEHGKFAVIVNRSESESIGETERGWLRTMYHEHDRVILTLPASLLSRCMRKMRSASRYDYSDDQLTKRLDLFLRSYLAIQHESPRKRRRNKNKSKETTHKLNG